MLNTIALLALSAHALPLYDAGFTISTKPAATGQEDTCVPMDRHDGVWSEVASQIDDRLHVYLAADSADVYTARTNTEQDVTQEDFRAMLLESLEVWNRESRGPVLQYEGETEVSLLDPNDFAGNWTCTWAQYLGGPDYGELELPAVIVSAISMDPHNDPERLYDGLGGVYVLKDSNGSCASQGAPLLGLNIQSPSNLQSAKNTMVHELGHALGLGHAFGDVDDPNIGFVGHPSVMHYNLPTAFQTSESRSGDAHRDQWRQHLWPYDVDCVDDDFDQTGTAQQDARERLLDVAAVTYTPTSNQWSDVEPVFAWTAKGSVTPAPSTCPAMAACGTRSSRPTRSPAPPPASTPSRTPRSSTSKTTTPRSWPPTPPGRR